MTMEVPKTVTRAQVVTALTELGLNADDCAELEMTPSQINVAYYLHDASGHRYLAKGGTDAARGYATIEIVD